MSVKDVERSNAQQVELLRRRMEREVKSLETNHTSNKAEIKKGIRAEIVDLQQENERTLNMEAEKKEKVLADMKDHLNNTKKITDKELRELQEGSTDKKKAINGRFEVDRDQTMAQNTLALDELNNKYQTQAKKIHQDGKTNVTDMTASMNGQYVREQRELQKKINDQNGEFISRYKREGTEYENMHEQALYKNKHLRINTNRRQQSEMAKLTDHHKNVMDQRDVEFRKGLKEQDVFFEKRYQTNQASHTKDANNLDNRFQEIMNKMKNEISSEVKKTADKSSDAFYQFTELRPTWTKTEEGVEVKVAIPEYSKHDIQIFTNNKEVILNFNRRFTDSNKLNGIANKVNKVESFTSRIDTDVILNAKTITQSYADGVMTYNIKKA